MKIYSTLLLLGAATIASAQNAQLSGLVSDNQDAVVPNAVIQALNQQTGIHRTAASNREGYYSMPALPPGRYKVTAQANGFQTESREGIKLEVDQNARLD